jgi:hypothetical protein
MKVVSQTIEDALWRRKERTDKTWTEIITMGIESAEIEKKAQKSGENSQLQKSGMETVG